MMDNNKHKLIDLWRICFNDSEAFVRLFFDRIYQKGNALFIEEKGEIVSALQMLPYTLNYYGAEIPISYIYAACTHPSVRGRGLMRRLLREAFEKMEHRGMALTVIIPAEPWLFDYYRASGYTEAFDYSEESYLRPAETVREAGVRIVTSESMPTETLYSYFDRKQRERACYVLHGYDDFVTLLRDLQQSGGQAWVAANDRNEPVGMLFSDPAGNHIRVKEGMYDNASVKALLLQEATARSQVDRAVCRTVCNGAAETHPFGMARILDRDRLIRHWVSTHEHADFDIEKLKGMETSSLTRLLLGYRDREAYMSLMLD